MMGGAFYFEIEDGEGRDVNSSDCDFLPKVLRPGPGSSAFISAFYAWCSKYTLIS